MEPLPQAPRTLADERGAPRFGAYAGRIGDTSLAGLVGRFRRTGLARLAAEKRWLYLCVSSPTLLLAGTVVSFGWSGGGFLYVFDRRERRLLADHAFRLPAKLVELDDNAAEARGRLRGLRSQLLIEASRLGGQFFASAPGLLAEVRLRPEGAPEPLTAVCPVPGDRVTMTQKSALIPAEGEVRVGGRTFRLEEAFASLDYTHGFLARQTRWRWASGCGRLADGRRFGFNLVEGHNDGLVTENGMWLEDRLWPLGRARFEFDPGRPLEPWAISTEDGSVRLFFQAEGVRSEDFDYRLVASQYEQPIGSFSGTVRTPEGEELAVEGLPGVTENHRSVW